MNLAKLKAARDAELQSANALAALDTLTDEQQAQLDTHLKNIDNYDAQIQRAEKLAALKPSSPGLEKPLNASVHDRAEDKPFAHFGDFLMSVKNAAEPGVSASDMDPRLRKHDLRNLEVRAATGLNETVGSEGGFVVHQDTSMELINRAQGASVVFSRCRRLPLGPNSNGIKIPYVDETSRANGSRWGGVQAYWADEAAEKTASQPKYGRLELNLKKLVGLCYATDELLQDASALGSFISMAFTDEFAFKLDDAVIRGTGAGTPLGILNATAKVEVAKETSQAAATVKYANINKMWARLWSRSKGSAIWLINQDVTPQLEAMTVDVKNVAGTENVGGTAVYVPPGGATAAPHGTLKGRPVLEIEQCETLGTAGDIILFDPSQYLTIAKDMQAASSIHVRFIYDESCFRFVYRVDGQPAWKQALTPYKGTNTISPFITLATRA